MVSELKGGGKMGWPGAYEAVAKEKGIEIDLEKIEDLPAIMGYGVMSTPGVVIDGQVVHARGVPKLQRHIYDYVITDSDVERKFDTELDTAKEVVVYAKLPKGFFIPAPVGDYNPDWAIAFKEGSVKHVYFVAETKGSMSLMELRPLEATKIECARKFFRKINQRYAPENVKYDVLNSFGKLMELIK